MLAVIVGFMLFICVCAIALLLGQLAQKHATSSLHQPLRDYSDYVRYMRDKHDLNRLGHAQQLTRRMGGVASFGFSFSGMCLVGCACWLLLPAIAQGGPAVLGFGWPVLGLFAILTACVCASAASGVPSSGGIYHWVSAVSGRRWGLLAGGLHMAGQAILYAVTNVLAASWLNETLSESFGYTAAPLGNYVLLTVLFAVQLWTSARSAAHLGRLFAAAAWLEISAILAILAGLAYMTGAGYWPMQMIYEPRHPVDALSAGPDVISALLGLLLLYRGLSGSERAGGMAEETEDPRLNTPWAIYLSTVYAVIFGYMLFAFLLVHIPFSPEAGGLLEGVRAVMDGETAWLSRTAALIVFLFAWSSGAGCVTGMARIGFAMARDHAVPMAEWFQKVSVRRRSPVRVTAAISIGCAGIGVAVLSVYSYGGEAALPVQPLLLAFLLLHAALAIVAFGRCAARLGGRTIMSGPWRLGKLEPWIDWLTAAWSMAWLVCTAWLLTAFTWYAFGFAALFVSLIALWRRHGAGHAAHPLSATEEKWNREALEPIIRIERKFPQ